MKTPVTLPRLKEHLRYNWWKYLLIVAIGIGLVDMLYAVTKYRSPRDKTISFYVYGYIDDAGLTAYMDNVHETEMSDMEEVYAQLMINDSTYGPVQLMTTLAVGEGDVYLLPRENFLNFAPSGSLVPLENDPELMALFDEAGISLQSGWRRDTETGETHLYGIPQDKLPGLAQYAWAQDGYLCIIASGGNQVNAMKFLRILCRDMITATAAEPAPQE